MYKTLIAITFSLLSALSFAEITLTNSLIENWLSSQKALEQWGEKHQDALDAYENQMAQEENPFTIDPETMIRPLKESGLYAQAYAVVKPFGFDSMEHWAEATLSITKAAAAVEFENSPAMFDPEQIKTMLESANLSAEHKAMMESALEHNMIMANSLKSVSKEHKEIVRPFLGKISQLMEEE